MQTTYFDENVPTEEEAKNELENIKEAASEEVDNSQTKGISASDYKLIVNLIHEMEDQYNTLHASIISELKTKYDLKESVIDAILQFKKSELDDMDVEKIKDFLLKHSYDATILSKTDDEVREIMKAVKSSSNLLISTREEAKKLKEDTADIMNDFFEYFSSEKVRSARIKRLEALKAAVENEENEIQKHKMKKMIESIESSLSFSFLFKRFEKLGEKEVKSIEEGFFNNKKGMYVVKRYVDKIHNFGFREDIYKYFFNIEEKFLNKKYSPFNNLFLFIYMRFVANADPYNKSDKMYVQSITCALANLIYHKFESQEAEDLFIKTISEILDNFMDDTETFIACNSTYEKHQLRIQAEAEHDKRRRESLIKYLNDLNVESEKSFDEMTTDELQKLYNDTVDKLTEENLEENKKKKSVTFVTEEEN